VSALVGFGFGSVHGLDVLAVEYWDVGYLGVIRHGRRVREQGRALSMGLIAVGWGGGDYSVVFDVG
jgi:hypothetical protein